jgi:tetratricopeptide (TPR) repeat protein
MGNYAAARACLSEALQVLRAAGDQLYIARSLHRLAELAREQDDYDTAQPLLEEAIMQGRQLGDRYFLSRSLSGLGLVAQARGDDDQAEALFQEALVVARELPVATWHIPLRHLAGIAIDRHDYRRARTLLEEGLALERQQGRMMGIMWFLRTFAWLAVALDQAQDAARLVGAAEAMREMIKMSRWPSLRRRDERLAARAIPALGEDKYNRAWAEGHDMTPEEAADYALRHVQPA